MLVLDHAEHVGGLAASFDLAGMSVDYGSHRLPARLAPDVASDLETLLGDDLQTRRRTARVRVAERWVPAGTLRLRPAPAAAAPDGDRDGLGHRAVRAAPARCGGLRRRHERRVGRRIYDAVYEPYARKIWDQPGNRLDAAAAGRIVSADITWRSGRRYRAAGSEFRYPRRGFGQIATALAEAATGGGRGDPARHRDRRDRARVRIGHRAHPGRRFSDGPSRLLDAAAAAAGAVHPARARR